MSPGFGTNFETWRGHTPGIISAAAPFCTEAFLWAFHCETSEAIFAKLAGSGGFVSFDVLLMDALMECTLSDTPPRQEIENATTQKRQAHQRNITGRQVLMLVHRFSGEPTRIST